MKIGRYHGGCIPSPDGVRGTHDPMRMLGMLLSTPNEVDCSNLLPEVLNQGSKGSCTGFGGSTEPIWAAMNAAAFAAGQPAVERPSPDWAYLIARSLEGNLSADSGASISSVLGGARLMGSVKESQCPYLDYRLNPDRDAWPALGRLANDQRILDSTARITETGPAMIDALRAALAGGYLPAFGTDVDAAFESLDARTVWLGCRGQSLGGHALCLTGYRTINSRTQFRIRNSWGIGWGDNGSCWCDQSAVSGFWDVWVVKSAPSWSGTEDK
jgi:hypothetical protein